MGKFISRIAIAFPVWFMLGSNVFAMCIWFAPPSRQFAPASNMKTLIAHDDGRVRMVVQPEFSGDATDFALVMPFPSQPELGEAPVKIFDELENLTNPELDFSDVLTLESAVDDTTTAASSGVRVVEERDVGDYSAVTLTADSSNALSDWLIDNGYEITDDKRDIIAQYVSQDGYFVALKVNVDKADVDELGILQGKLNPIEFAFDSETATLPLRLMAGDGSLVTLTVYTLSDDLTYIPGADIQFSKKVTASDQQEASSLEDYDAWRKWLVRNVVQLDTANITADLDLLTTIDTVVVVPEEQSVVLNPELLPVETGVLVSETGEIKYTDETVNEASDSAPAEKSSPVTWAMVVALSISNIITIIILISKNEQKKSS